jgi:hypothetical protein
MSGAFQALPLLPHHLLCASSQGLSSMKLKVKVTMTTAGGAFPSHPVTLATHSQKTQMHQSSQDLQQPPFPSLVHSQESLSTHLLLVYTQC